MKALLSPFCLLLALATLIAGFAALAVGSPEANVELHRARVGEDDRYRDLLEDELLFRQRRHTALVMGLFVLSGLLAATAFWTMQTSESSDRRGNHLK